MRRWLKHYLALRREGVSRIRAARAALTICRAEKQTGPLRVRRMRDEEMN